MTDDSQSLYEQAVAASRQKDFASARVLLRQLLKQEPNHLNAWLLAAHVVETRSDAIACLKRVLQLDPGHVYARQKLSTLQGEPPAISPVDSSNARSPLPPAGAMAAANRPTAYRPEAIQPQVDSRPQTQASNPPASRFNLQTGVILIAGILILGILCVAFVGVAASSQNGLSFFGTAVPTPTNEQLFSVLYQNVQAAGAENVTGYMATIHSGSFMYAQTESVLKTMFSQYDLTFQVYNLKVISANSSEARVHFSLVTRKVNGPAFRNNIITGTMILRPDKGVWKIYNQEIEDTKFEN